MPTTLPASLPARSKSLGLWQLAAGVVLLVLARLTHRFSIACYRAALRL